MNDELNDLTKKELLDRAKALGIPGIASLRKDDLVKAIRTAQRKQERAKAKSAAAPKPAPSVNGHAPKPLVIPPAKPTPARSTGGTKPPVGRTAPKSPEVPGSRSEVPTRDLSARTGKAPATATGKDRLLVMVRDPYWLHCYWELSNHAVQRAEAALGQDWHGAKPILRLCDVSSYDTTSTAESVVKDVDIHGGCNNWYIEVTQPPRSYRIDIGYLTRRGQFFVLARSNIVTTPKAGASDTMDEHWTDFDARQADRIYAMSSGFDPNAGDNAALKELFEERLRRPLGAPTLSSFSPSSLMPTKDRKFFFGLDAELIVFGRTEPGARVTLQGEPVKLRPDGTFTMRYSFPDGRQILPAVAESADGVEERKIVLAVERNTKALEPLIHDGDEE